MRRLRAPGAPGFSLVELLVSVVIGLLALMFATRMVARSESSKQGFIGGSDTMQNGVIALFSIERDISQAGWGLNEPLVVGCDTVFSDTAGYALATTTLGGATVRPMASALITDNGDAPDTLSLYAGSSMSGTGMMRLSADYAAGTQLDVDRDLFGFAVGDAILVAPETQGAARCAMAQVSALVPAAALGATNSIKIDSGAAHRFNSGGLGAVYSNNQARLFNLGPASRVKFHTWSVQNGFLRLRATDLAGASSTASTVIDNIVSLKAQYGLDTRAGAAFTPELGMQIGVWSSAMTDADGDGVVGGATDYQRIAAVRVAIVARSRAPDKPGADGTCTATTTKPSVFATAGQFGVTAVPVEVTVAVAGDPLAWECYRYRVFETIVPLRNSGWRPTS